MHILKYILYVLNTFAVHQIPKQIKGFYLEMTFFKNCDQVTKATLRKHTWALLR